MRSLVFLSLFLLASGVWAEDYQPKIASSSQEGTLAIDGFRIPEGMSASLVAGEPDVANPVAFAIDAQGRFYICETFRQKKGVEDNRNHMNWLHDDLAAKTVEDRLAYFRKHLKDKVEEYGVEHDRIRVLEDTDGDGTVDKATVFADGFSSILTGTGAGVLPYQGNVYYTCIPDLWLLKDTNGDNRADVRESLGYGFGVRVAFRGHDMHGLTIGPDGRLYFSIGDRGLNVTTKEGKQLILPDTGAVLRCELDGSNLELFATGLRNPQELAFDDFGNLFTGDNNSDSGDKARWVYVIPGSDTGWRMYFQYLKDRGPWNRERMWYPYQADDKTRKIQPAFIVPPIANLGDGPSGLTYYPGIGLPERYAGHFFLCDFRGSAGKSGIRSFAVQPKGASFELTDSHQFLWSILATDADFGYDGSLYATDWVEGWDGPGKGRLYRFTNQSSQSAVKEAGAQKLMKEGFDHRSPSELQELLSHADKRIRQEAQFALVRKKADDALLKIAQAGVSERVQIHAIWALGQRIRQGEIRLAENLVALARKSSLPDEVLAQTLHVVADSVPRVGGVLNAGSLEVVANLLDHESARVAFFAAYALGMHGEVKHIAGLLSVLDKNQDQDPMLRHAAVMGLVGIAERNPGALDGHLSHPSRFGRMGVLLSLRRLKSPQIANFLNDAESDLILEAARAINDVPIEAAQTALSQLAGRPGLSSPLLRRVINANFRLGTSAGFQNLIGIAADDKLPEAIRLDAISALRGWTNPPPLDRVTGRWRPLDAHSDEGLADAIRPRLGGLFQGSNAIRQEAAKLASQYGIREVAPVLVRLIEDPKNETETRVAALSALAGLKTDKLSQAIESALSSAQPELRAEARRLIAQRDPEKAVEILAEAITTGETVEKQSALRDLAQLKSQKSTAALVSWMDQLKNDAVPKGIQLDILEAAKNHGPPLKSEAQKFLSQLNQKTPVEKYQIALEGGDAKRGEEIFFGRSDASCRRCHMVRGSGGEVGPDLSDIALKQKRDYLLEAIVDPNGKIAKGFETIQVATSEGEVILGVFKSEDDNTLFLMNKDGGLIRIPKEQIEDRAVGKSAMPSDLIKTLSMSDVRDLVEYLASLKFPKQDAKTEHKE